MEKDPEKMIKKVATELSVHVTTRSNLFIGGSPSTFEIGGVDLFTVTNQEGLPYIPASSFKGTLRHIVREMIESHGYIEGITQAYTQYLMGLQEKNIQECEKYGIDQDRIKRMKERYDKVIGKVSAEYLFGIEGFNDTPKLLFNDLMPLGDKPVKEEWFSIDSKNSIELSDLGGVPQVAANPRTYRVVRPGITFKGDVLFYNMDKLKLDEQSLDSQILSFVKEAMIRFNSGHYRLGNSGSRGYGRVEIQFDEEDSSHG
ncbi:RAMP superfamily CRISPR-associated protein [Paenibacillus xylanexedens]|uniref:RAMP superfamily CRISPR-associated protein n=1 Tax=Paenibacillus xylanexedens TaxID=528191 RepID=UPI003CFE5921